MKGYLCEDSIEGIFTGIYDAWASGLGHENVRILMEKEYEPELFMEYESVKEDGEKAEKVARAIHRKISPEAFRSVYKAAMSFQPDRADIIYRFLIEGFRYRENTIRMLGLPAVSRLFMTERKVTNESHQFREFIRFEQLDNGVLFSVIEPKCNVLTLVAPHFEDRFSGENWVIYDQTREQAVIHERLKPFVLAKLSREQADAFLALYRSEDCYPELWKVFFKTIGIKDRENYRCQRNLLPLWYRKHMTEFL